MLNVNKPFALALLRQVAQYLNIVQTQKASKYYYKNQC